MNEGGGRPILEMAHRYARRGLIFHATDLYLRLLRRTPHAQEGREARCRIIEIAVQHEAKGRRYLAASLYKQLLAIPAAMESPSEGEAGAEGRPAERKWFAFVDLREEIDMKQNFERLGRVQRRRMDILRTVNMLKELKGSGVIPYNKR